MASAWHVDMAFRAKNHTTGASYPVGASVWSWWRTDPYQEVLSMSVSPSHSFRSVKIEKVVKMEFHSKYSWWPCPLPKCKHTSLRFNIWCDPTDVGKSLVSPPGIITWVNDSCTHAVYIWKYRAYLSWEKSCSKSHSFIFEFWSKAQASTNKAAFLRLNVRRGKEY